MGKKRTLTELENLERRLNDNNPDADKVFFVDLAFAFAADVRALNAKYEELRTKLIKKIAKEQENQR